MSAQRLNARSVRRIERSTGESIVRAWAHGGYVMDFVTTDHRHGLWDKKTGAFEYVPAGDRYQHYSSCHEMFPGF